MSIRWKPVGITLVCWTLYGLLMTAPSYIDSAAVGSPVSWGESVVFSVYSAWLWAAFTPLILWLSRQLPIERRDKLRNLLIHLLAGLAIVAAHLMFARYTSHWVAEYFLGQRPQGQVWSNAKYMIAVGPYEVVVYAVAASIAYALDYFRKYRWREKSLDQARLQALKAQLNPHFLYNTLNAIAELGFQSPEDAAEMMTRLSDLLRLSFDNDNNEQEIALHDELVFTRKYLEVQKLLLGDRLTVHLDIAPDTDRACVPNFLLQPLVENAVVHGIAPHARPGLLEISSERGHDQLVLTISDSGTGLPSGHTCRSNGIGLTNTRSRLRQLYGAEAKLLLENRAGGGLCVTLRLPFRPYSPQVNEYNPHPDRGRRPARATAHPALSR